jgi:hypothetical protein
MFVPNTHLLMNDPEIPSVPQANPQEATNSPQRRDDAENAAHEQSKYMAVAQAACEDWAAKRVTHAQEELRNWASIHGGTSGARVPDHEKEKQEVQTTTDQEETRP